MPANTRSVSVVICAYTLARWDQTRAAVESALSQEPAPAQVLLVIDHNPELAALARGELTGITVLDSEGPRGLSGARNTGLRAASEPVTVFLDDDAQARPGWLTALTEPYLRGDVVATGGGVHPLWPGEQGDRPRWMPVTFDWVVGCSYLGLPESTGVVRNPIGANMSMRTDLARQAGGFDATVGRVGATPRGCEETELAIRLTAGAPGSVVLHVPDAAVDHHVAPDRVKLGYFLRRCWHEGQSKAEVVKLAGASAGLGRERRHAAAVIPASMLRDLRRLAGGDLAASARFAAAFAGLSAATAGYLVRRLRLVAMPGADRSAERAALVPDAAVQPKISVK